MKPKLNKLRILYTIIIILFSLLTIETFAFLWYRYHNPPTTMCKETKINNRSGLISYWKLDNINNDSIPDHSNNGNHGVLNSTINIDFPFKMFNYGFKYIAGSSDIVKGINGNAIKLYGREWISGGNIEAYNTDVFTISAWVKREDSTYYTPTIMAKSSWPDFDGWWLCTSKDHKYIDMGIAWGSSFAHVKSGYALPMNEWHHIAVTMDNKKHEVQFFIDGIPFGEKHENVHEWRTNVNHSLFIGDYDGSGRWPWVGQLDEVRFYNKILTEKEIHSLFIVGKDI